MYRILIADDEALEREGLEWIIQRMMPDTFQVIHADNGRTAIERAEEHRPHIVMMDVNMPGIQGLAAIREIKERLPDTKFVLVTAYDYFAYAKEALTLGVKEYLLKPAKREQIVTVLEELISEIKVEKQRRQDVLELKHKLSQLLPLVENELSLMFMVDQTLDTDAEQLSEWLDFPLAQGCAIVVAFPEHAHSQSHQKIYDIIRSFAKTNESSCIISSLIERHMAIFLGKESRIQEDLWREQTKRFGEKLAMLTERQLQYEVSIGIGTLGSGADGFRKSYFEAVFASTYDAHQGNVCHFDELKQAVVHPLSESESHSFTAESTHRSYVISALHHIREEREKQTLTVLDRAQGYIQERFTEDLSLEEVADFVHLNPHYFSKIFKQQTGSTFIDYVTNLRIDKAKILMSSDHLSLKEVCYKVGYNDPNYFSRVFKKVTGITASEFRGQTKS
ncbi:response regulator [Paenibacillus glacialis]|uniref:DNA-binding response regulator n=1 Tax=Paenibacillus glacialis TaxID=494026 RepID=A0A168F8C9_9BACL|nr:response regulator [Paenibacillus glacialis]OAB35957.1 DNA-binding response regulator [Paenibacillus glacialis]